MSELKAFGRSWWCRGGGAAVLTLLVVANVFRAPRDLLFWAAVAFFVGHTALAVRRYRRDRKARVTTTVIRHHEAHVPLIFGPPLLVPLKITTKDLLQQTKNPL